MARFQRRDMLRGCLGSSLALGTGGWLLGPGSARAAVAPAASIRALMLGEVFAGPLIEVEGGGVVGEVVPEQPGPDRIGHKHIGNVKYEDIKVVCGAGMAKIFWDWNNTYFAPNKAPTPRSGAIVTFDEDRKFVSGRDFTDAVITELGFPALDAAGNDAARLTMTLRPAAVRAGAARKPPKALLAAMRPWRVCDYRLKIGGLEAACGRVGRIGALALRRTPGSPLQVEAPDLVATLAESDADPFFAWHEDFVVKGRNTQDREKTGTLEYLSPEGVVLFALKLDGLGIFRVGPAKDASAGPRPVKVEMYCESMTVAASPG